MSGGQLSILEETASSLLTSAETTIKDAAAFNDLVWFLTIEETATTLVNETHKSIVNKVTGFAVEVMDIVTNTLAPCYRVWAVYTSLYVTFCESVLGGLVSSQQIFTKTCWHDTYCVYTAPIYTRIYYYENTYIVLHTYINYMCFHININYIIILLYVYIYRKKGTYKNTQLINKRINNYITANKEASHHIKCLNTLAYS